METVFIRGTDLRAYLTPIGLLKMNGIPPAVGEDYQIPGYAGAIATTLGRGPRVVTVGGLLTGTTVMLQPTVPNVQESFQGVPLDPLISATSTTPVVPQDVATARANYQNKLLSFTQCVYNDGTPFTLTWSTPAHQFYASARYQAGVDEIEQLTPWAGRVAVEFLLLTPFWEVN